MALQKLIKILKKAEKEINLAVNDLLKGKARRGWKERTVLSKKVGRDKSKDIFIHFDVTEEE